MRRAELPGGSASQTPIVPIEALPGHPQFVHLSRLAQHSRGIDIDLRYPTANNFAGRVLYTGWDCAWLRAEAAQGLLQAAQWLEGARPGWRIRVLDALRPHRVQLALWDDVKGTPMQPYFADPAHGSIHSFGMAVDVTLLLPDGREADMGSGFDEMSELSHPALHDQHLAQGVLDEDHVRERQALLQAMQAGGFRGISTEWWHFDLGDRHRVRREGPRVD
jgi:zinc D-Ala-D-Ala dipeptidase